MPETPIDGSAGIMGCNATAIRRAARHVSRFYDQCLAAVALRTTQYVIMRLLGARGPANISDLAAILVMDRSTLSQNLRPLERAGLIEIFPDPQNRRRTSACLTIAGKTRLTEAHEHWEAAQRRFAQAMGEIKARALRLMMSNIAETDFG